MGASKNTPVLGLPQYTGEDKPSWITDVNSAFLDIDKAIGEINAKMEQLTFLSELTQAGLIPVIVTDGSNINPIMVRCGKVFTLYFPTGFSGIDGERIKFAHMDGNIFNLKPGEAGDENSIAFQASTIDSQGGDTHLHGAVTIFNYDALTNVTYITLTNMPTTPMLHYYLCPVIIVRRDYNECN